MRHAEIQKDHTHANARLAFMAMEHIAKVRLCVPVRFFFLRDFLINSKNDFPTHGPFSLKAEVEVTSK